MAFFKCKMCGGTMEFTEGATVGVCDSCGTKQTLPRLDDDRRANLYDRANHFRRNNEFDKAASIYEQILNEDTSDAEAYWSLVLCQYGIEYVEDPATHKRVPTVNRAQFTSIFDDEDYKAALKYADASQKEIYCREAEVINEIQKKILLISEEEEPFDIFICYKETDEGGRRTPDSVLAAEMYHELTKEGFRVFFSRVTLEDKLGQEYEPYIFAALNSAKIMVALGTKPEHFNAVWVKNEWSRYLALVKASGGKKILIPAYKDTDPYDLPEEFSHLQAQDMSKLGFMQDLLRGIKKIIGSGENTDETPTVQMDDGESGQLKSNDTESEYDANISAADYNFLKNKWIKAKKYYNKALLLKPDSYNANKGLLFCKLKISSFSDYSNKKNIRNLREYKNVLNAADENQKNELNVWITETEKKTAERKVQKRKKRLTVAKVASLVLLTVIIVIFAILPTINYFKIKGLLKNNKIEEAVESYYSSKSIHFPGLTEKAFEKYGKNLSTEANPIEVFELYRYNGKDKNKKLYSAGCELVKRQDYETAEKVFLQIYEYKDAKNYLNYCKGRRLLADYDTAAYNYLSLCRGFLDTDELFASNANLAVLDAIQGEWYYTENYWVYVIQADTGNKERVLREHKRILKFENDLLFEGFPDYYGRYKNEETQKLLFMETGLSVLFESGDISPITVIDSNTFCIKDLTFKKSSD